MGEAASETAVVEPPPALPPSGPMPNAPLKQASTPPRLDKLPPYKVLLHNDDHTPMELVVRTIKELTPLNSAQVFMVMMTAHTRGLGLLLVTHKERAELYREQFASKKLTVTIEAA